MVTHNLPSPYFWCSGKAFIIPRQQDIAGPPPDRRALKNTSQDLEGGGVRRL